MSHQADAKRLFDSRGYTGATIHDQNPVPLRQKPARDRIVGLILLLERAMLCHQRSHPV